MMSGKMSCYNARKNVLGVLLHIGMISRSSWAGILVGKENVQYKTT